MRRATTKCIRISIHALRVEGDDFIQGIFTGNWISIHALRVEGDHVAPETGRRIEIFLSTPSGWRATLILFKAFSPATGFLSTPSGWRAT